MTDKEKSRVMNLYQKLLDLLKKEEAEIKDNDIDKIEHNCSLKMNILKELTNCTFCRQNINESPELVSIIKKIEDIQRSNTDAVEQIKNAVMGEISALNKGKSALRAYTSSMLLRS